MNCNLLIGASLLMAGIVVASCSQERPNSPIASPAHTQNSFPPEARELMEGWVSNGDINANLLHFDRDMMIPKDAMTKLEQIHLLPVQDGQRVIAFSIDGITRRGSKMIYFVHFDQHGKIISVECMGQGQP